MPAESPLYAVRWSVASGWEAGVQLDTLPTGLVFYPQLLVMRNDGSYMAAYGTEVDPDDADIRVVFAPASGPLGAPTTIAPNVPLAYLAMGANAAG